MPALNDQLAQAQADLATLTRQLADKNTQVANMYANYTACVNFCGANNAGCIDNCWKNNPPHYLNQYQQLQGEAAAIQTSITQKQAEINSIQNSINNDPAALAAQNAAKTRTEIIWVVVIVAVIGAGIATWVYLKRKHIIK